MPKVSNKRQITLTVYQCEIAGINPGDEVESFVDNYGHIIIIKKYQASTKGIMKEKITDKRSAD